MLLVVIFLTAFTISLRCDATENFSCLFHDSNLKLLSINCNGYQQKNCVQEISLNASDVIGLKIEGCALNIIGEASDKYPNIQSLDISHSRYSSLNWTGKVFENVVHLNVSFNELAAFPALILSQFPNLETLDLSHNNIAIILNGSLKNCAKLKRINLSNNSLIFIDRDALKSLNGLLEVDLAHNHFSTFPPAVAKLSSVNEIDLSENRELTAINCTFVEAMDKKIVHFTWDYIETIEFNRNCSQWQLVLENSESEGIHPGLNNTSRLQYKRHDSFKVQNFMAGPHVFANVSDILSRLGPSVMKIDLSNNNVDLDGNAFNRFPRLHALSLRNAGLKIFDFKVLNTNHQNFLHHLDISENDLKTVKSASLLKDYENLKSFNAAGRIQNANEIAQFIPGTIEQLNLAGNQVGNIDVFNTIERLEALTHLNLSDTNLTISNANLFKPLRDLISLDLSHNNLGNVNIDTILAAADKLQEFRVSNCHLKNASEFIQHVKPSMRILDLSGNDFGPSINSSFLSTLSNLTHLNLSGTHLHKFELDSLIPLRELHTLDISRNQLQNINLKALANLTQLEHLYLNDNDLTQLDNFDWTASPNVSLAIGGNQFSCMHLKDLRHEIPNLKYIGNQLHQKHGEDCLSSAQAIGDFLGSVYDKVKFW